MYASRSLSLAVFKFSRCYAQKIQDDTRNGQLDDNTIVLVDEDVVTPLSIDFPIRFIAHLAFVVFSSVNSFHERAQQTTRCIYNKKNKKTRTYMHIQ